jgi:hypothetical protein
MVLVWLWINRAGSTHNATHGADIRYSGPSASDRSAGSDRMLAQSSRSPLSGPRLLSTISVIRHHLQNLLVLFQSRRYVRIRSHQHYCTWSDLPARQCQDRLERPPQKHFWRLEQFLWGSVKNRFKNLNTLWRKDTCRAQKNTRRTASMSSLQLESLRVDRTSSNGATRACDS